MDEHDIEIPDPIPLNFVRVRQKQFERAHLEVTHLFRSAEERREALVEFEKRWDIQARSSYAKRLAFDEVYRPEDQTGPLHGPHPENPIEHRSQIYRRRAHYKDRVEVYRRKLGLPPEDRYGL